MARQDALNRLKDRLLAQRNALRNQINDDLGLVSAANDGINDIGESAFEVERVELHSQLAAMESLELEQIEQAIQSFREGRFGLCEHCQKPIPIARLEALPFTTHCVSCQTEAESAVRHPAPGKSRWKNPVDVDRLNAPAELSLRDLSYE